MPICYISHIQQTFLTLSSISCIKPDQEAIWLNNLILYSLCCATMPKLGLRSFFWGFQITRN